MVSVHDPAAGQWSEVAPLIGQEEMAGFGVSGWSIFGELLVPLDARRQYRLAGPT